ncbi:hypothetical protein [Pseudofrankia sp. BMG5.37]|uniref:hypothetical protein n=1 Tax=Pseudofrankia sp. BMG5.37 TaxID=3050035 RepID=UPI002893C47D|nr:hypothetical protein [Pseudofrankia sp. BMG5.37]MDT3438186.1 hypothetical protein [Pseudofrankia sp. BMG5.37]
MITGYDHVELVAGSGMAHVKAFLERVQKHWADMLLAIAPGDFEPALRILPALPESKGDILVARDKEMIRRWDKDGYHLHRGEGPFSVLYEPMGTAQIKTTLLQDPYGPSDYKFTPYEATLLGRNISLITLVLPDEGSGFSRKLIQEFESATPGSRHFD